MSAPPKPWELRGNRSLVGGAAATPITAATATAAASGTASPRVPPRSYSGASAMSPYGGGMMGTAGYGGVGGYGGMNTMSRYGAGGMYGGGGYGGYGGMGGYGSPYGRRGGMMGRSMYGRGGMYGGMNQHHQMPGQPMGWYENFQNLLQSFGQFSQLLDGSVFSIQDSFTSLVEFFFVMGELKQHLAFFVKAITTVLFLRMTGRNVYDWVVGNPPKRRRSPLGQWEEIYEQPATRSVWPRLFLVLGVSVLFGPFIIRALRRMFSFGTSNPQAFPEISRRVVAVHDYRAENPEELELRQGDIIEVLDDQSNRDWWFGRNRMIEGYFPGNYTEPFRDDEEDSSSYEEDEEEEEEQEAPRSRRRTQSLRRKLVKDYGDDQPHASSSVPAKRIQH